MILGIYGAGGTGMAISDYILRTEKLRIQYDKLIFVDDVLGKKQAHGLDVFTFENARRVFPRDELQFLIGLGDPAARERVFNQIENEGFGFATCIHPNTEIASTAIIGEGSCIADNCYIDNNVIIGKNVMIYPQTFIGHDTVIKDHAFVSVRSFIGGHSVLDKKVYYGPCAVCKDKIHIGEGAIIGPNATLYKDVPAHYTAIGNPARIIPRTDDKVFH